MVRGTRAEAMRLAHEIEDLGGVAVAVAAHVPVVPAAERIADVARDRARDARAAVRRRGDEPRGAAPDGERRAAGGAVTLPRISHLCPVCRARPVRAGNVTCGAACGARWGHAARLAKAAKAETARRMGASGRPPGRPKKGTVGGL